jgi:WD40 repeat protein
LGEGGMGAVYKAVDLRLDNRLVAVKEMLPQAGLPYDAVAAFRQEANMLAKLRHSNLPVIYDHFCENGRWYLVMDFIDGETLEEYVNSTQESYLPVNEVLAIGIELCTILDYLHAQRPPIIFRDLKPLNIMRTRAGKLYLIDFGIARHFKTGQGRDTFILGTPGYAAPEVAYGQTTPRSDIYSLGVTLYRLLSGHRPNPAVQQLQNQTVPPALIDLIMQMIEINPSQRPESAVDVRDRLQDIVHAAGQSTTPGKLIRRHLSRRALLVGLAGVAAVGGAGGIMWSLLSPPPKVGTTLYTYTGHQAQVNAVTWSPDGMRIASASNDGTVRVWDSTTGNNPFVYRRHQGDVLPVKWSPHNARLIASGGADKTVQVWDPVSGELIYTYKGHVNRVNALDWSPGGTRIASGSGSYPFEKKEDCTVQVWNAINGEYPLIYKGHKSPVTDVKWSPSEEGYIASSSWDGTVQVWESESTKLVYTYESHAGKVNAVTWSPDGKRVACACEDHTVRLWDATTGDNPFIYRHSAPVFDVAWSPDGKYIASGSSDKTVQVWDVTNKTKVLTYSNSSDYVDAVAWSPDSQRIASASGDAKVRVWQAQ